MSIKEKVWEGSREGDHPLCYVMDMREIYSPSTIHLCVEEMFASHGDSITATTNSCTDQSR